MLNIKTASPSPSLDDFSFLFLAGFPGGRGVSSIFVRRGWCSQWSPERLLGTHNQVLAYVPMMRGVEIHLTLRFMSPSDSSAL